MIVFAIQGDTVDQLCWRHLQATSGVVEATFELNPGIAKHGPVLPVGTKVKLPSLTVQVRSQKEVRLWD